MINLRKAAYFIILTSADYAITAAFAFLSAPVRPLSYNDYVTIANFDRQPARLSEYDHKMYKNFDPNNIVTVQNELDPTKETFLKDHTMNGIPILPGAVGIYGFKKAALRIAEKISAPDTEYRVAGMEDINFLIPIKFYRDKKKTVTWKAQGISRAGHNVINVSLESDLMFVNRPPEHVVHFTAAVCLTTDEVTAPAAKEPVEWLRKESVDAETIYKLYFHGPTFQVLDSVQRNGAAVIGRAAKNLKPLVLNDGEQSVIPMLIELCFQTAGVYQVGSSGILALPRSIQTLSVYDEDPKDLKDLYAKVTYSSPDDIHAGYDARVLDKTGNVILEIRGYVTAPLPFPVEEKLLEPMKILADSANDEETGSFIAAESS